ncbi:hypothetical protein ACFW04_012411 [Cataglyphis niger]
MKQCIQHAIRKRDIPRIILIAPPSLDKLTLAKILQEEIGNRPVTLQDLRAFSSAKIAMRMKEMLMSGILHESGWTLVDIPRSKKEARALQRVGVIPTHVIQIVSSNAENKTQQSILTVGSVSLTLLFFGVKTIQELGKECATLARIKKHYGAPSLFRIALIGPRGSGHHSLAKHISKRFNLVHVDFNYILEQACLQETALGEMLRLCECYGCGKKLKSEARIQIVEQYVLGSECLRKGWILTDYPKTVEEFKLLDMIPTPPNREYEENIKDIMLYAGETASVIDAMDEEKRVQEKLEACLMRSAPSAKPRIPETPRPIDPMDIEFDPDDEPDPKIFDDIRTPEPKYSFI